MTNKRVAVTMLGAMLALTDRKLIGFSDSHSKEKEDVTAGDIEKVSLSKSKRERKAAKRLKSLNIG